MRRPLPIIALLLGLGSANAQVTNWTFLRDDGTFSGVNVVGGTGSLSSPTTNKWFANDSPPTNELRWGDRVFVGDAATNYPNTTGCPAGGWFTAFEATTSNGICAYIGVFQSVIESHASNTNASAGLLAAGQTKNSAFSAFGLMGFALNNNVASTATAWAGYFECNQTVNSPSGCIGVEVDTANFVSNVFSGAPDPFTQSRIVAQQVACGSGLTSPTGFQCGSGIQIVPNPQPFKVGLNILTGSVTTQTIFGGSTSPGIVMPANYSMVWYSAAGTPVGAIFVDGSGNVNLAGSGVLKYNGVTVTVP